MKVGMKNPKTGEVKEVKVGWSWTLFLFSGVFGLPLFLRKLNIWGGICIALWFASAIVPSFSGDEMEALGISIAMMLLLLGMNIFLGIKGNEMTAKNYLEQGWEFIEPDSELVKAAKGKWGIAQ
jgi:Protein of unknown function (DUF2628).